MQDGGWDPKKTAAQPLRPPAPASGWGGAWPAALLLVGIVAVLASSHSASLLFGTAVRRTSGAAAAARIPGSSSGAGSGSVATEPIVSGSSGSHSADTGGSGTGAGRPCDAASLTGLLREGDVVWQNSSDGMPRLHLRAPHCTLRRFTAEQARQCLANRPVVFIGDSVSRYMATSLMFFLDRGHWPLEDSGEEKLAVFNSVVSRTAKWNTFFAESSALFGGRQRCYCYRNENPPPADLRESRFYRHEQHSLDLNYYYFSGFPPDNLTGLWGFPPFSNGSNTCQPGTCGMQPDWSMYLSHAMREVIPLHKPSVLVFSVGTHRIREWVVDWPPHRIDAMLRLAAESVVPQGGTAIWRMTTNTQDGMVSHDWDGDFLEAVRKYKWGILDGWALTAAAPAMSPPAFSDNVHVKGFVNRELNTVLLNMVCPPA